MPDQAWVDGKSYLLEEAMVPLQDRGYFFGDGVYEAVRVYAGKPFFLQAHLDRFRRSANAIRIAVPYSDSEFASICADLVGKSGYGDSYIYMQLTRGAAPREHAFPAQVKPIFSAYVRELSAEQLRKAKSLACCITLPDERWMNCYIKSVNLLPNCLARQLAEEKGASEAILFRPGGVVTEGTRSNIFAVIDGVLRTHPESNLILSGITRRILLDLAEELGIETREKAFTVEELFEAEEVWISSTISELQPVRSIDGRKLSGEAPGEMAQEIKIRFARLVARESGGLK